MVKCNEGKSRKAKETILKTGQFRGEYRKNDRGCEKRDRKLNHETAEQNYENFSLVVARNCEVVEGPSVFVL